MVIVKPRAAFILIVLAQTCCAALCHAQSPKLIGNWTVDIAFANGNSHSLRFEARDGGKGSFLLVDPKSHGWESGKALQAKWTQSNGNSVTFSGPIEFLIGNVGVDAGTLVFNGKLETEGSITGEVTFSPIGDGPSKSGMFKAIRTANQKQPQE